MINEGGTNTLKGKKKNRNADKDLFGASDAIGLPSDRESSSSQALRGTAWQGDTNNDLRIEGLLAESPISKALHEASGLGGAVGLVESPFSKALRGTSWLGDEAGLLVESPISKALRGTSWLEDEARLLVESPISKALRGTSWLGDEAGLLVESPISKALRGTSWLGDEAGLLVESPISKALHEASWLGDAARLVESPISKALRGTSWLGDAARLVESPISRALHEASGLGDASKTLSEITGGSVNYANPTLIERLNYDFFSRLSNLPKDYTYQSNKQKDMKESEIQETQFALISSKNKQTAVPINELESAFGLLDVIGKISEEEMVDFVSHLQRYPMLSLEHNVGITIRNAVKKMASKQTVTGCFYRCRIRKSEELMPWTEAEMWEAPHGLSGQGRFNTAGNGFLYLSRGEDTAILELKQPAGTLVDVMKLEIEAEIKVIDITQLDIALFRYCMFKASGSPQNKKEYLVPNFLAQCCQKEKIHAIKYKSVFNKEVSNYVFFDYLNEWFNYKSSASIRTKN
ncbi:RES family NAD+ phosphorylase [Paenibacillus chitinolyticus]